MKPVDDPLAQFSAWLKEAEGKEPNDPNAVAVATATKDGYPSVRMCLLKGADARGFVFFTNLGSRKAKELDDNPRAALLFHWKSLKRQVRVEGPVERVSNEEANAYFQTRARISQIGAWASKQSQPLGGRGELEGRVAKATARFGVGAVPRPEFWSGYRVLPEKIELWEDRPFRLHMRWLYEKTEQGWRVAELYP